MFQRHEVRRADDGLLIPNLVMEELPTIRDYRQHRSSQARLNEAAGAADATRAKLRESCRNVSY